MKLTNFKTVALMLLASAMLALTGCGSEGAPSAHNLLGEGAPLVRAPHDITTHVTTPVIVVSHTIAPTDGTAYTHAWTQVSGPPVTIANGTTHNAHVTPSTTGTVVVQHTVTNTATGATTTTHHTIAVVAPPASLQTHVSYAATVPGGYPSSIQASVAGGTGPYTYNWVQTGGPTVALDTSNPQTPIFTAPIVSGDRLIEYTLEVTDSTGLTDTKVISFTILTGVPTATTPPPIVTPPIKPLATSILIGNHDTNATTKVTTATFGCVASGGTKPYAYKWEFTLGFIPGSLAVKSGITQKSEIFYVSNGNNMLIKCTVTDASSPNQVSVSTSIIPPVFQP